MTETQRQSHDFTDNDRSKTFGIQSPSDSAIHKRSTLRLAIVMVALLAGALLLIGLPASWIHWNYGSVGCFLAKLRGDVIYVAQSDKVAGDVALPMRAYASYEIKNLAEAPVIIIGAKVTCGCLQVRGLPLRVGPMQVTQVSLDITPTESDRGRDVVQSALLYLDRDGVRPRLRAGRKITSAFCAAW
jgi:hypothetical protein